MNPTSSTRYDFSKPLIRKDFISLMNTAQTVNEFRFIRQSALAWLAIFPGDLFINYLLANALAGEGKNAQAKQILEKLVKSDPEFSQALELLNVCDSQPTRRISSSKVHKADWERAIDASQKAILNNQLEDAEQLALKAVQAKPDSPIPTIHHIQVAHASNDFKGVQQLAEKYHQQWPDCLQISLLLAEAQIVNGDETNAVALLHQCVARDPAGQVPTRIWGPAYPYRPIWPDRMEFHFDIPIPAALAMAMGWNQLAPGEPVPALSAMPMGNAADKTLEDAVQTNDEELPFNPDSLTGLGATEHPIELPTDQIVLDEDSEGVATTESFSTASSTDQPSSGSENSCYSEFTQLEEQVKVVETELSKKGDETEKSDLESTEQLLSIQEEFEKLAKKIKRPAVGRSDGRFPMYIVVSSKKNLEKQYGKESATTIDELMRSLVNAIRKRPGWGALLYYPDDPGVTSALGLKPVQGIDPWKIKLSLTDLDHELARRGEMIGTLLIVGGPDIIPFHHLPNPTEDSDTEVLSDNPYSTSDENYFIPEWPVGRLPGTAGNDASLLVEILRRSVAYHENLSRSHLFWFRNPLFPNFIRSLKHLLFRIGLVKGTRPSFAYTAQVWRSSSVEVFKPIGRSPSMLACPPTQAGAWNNGKLPAHMGYFNLHGIEDSVEWYGQKIPNSDPKIPDYPVAISPKDIQGQRQAPGIIFSEACYGALIEHKKEDEALAYKFLSNGTYGLVGSTGISYGSVSTPLIAADLLGYYFWQEIHQGQMVGNALMRAKLKHAKEMNHRQGYLDGEDQKTLLSFVLYGDPLAILDEYRPLPKTIYRSRNHPVVKMISDNHNIDSSPEKIPSDVMAQVKKIVIEYLPGLQDAELSYIQQQCNCMKGGPQCGSCQLKTKSIKKMAPQRYVITLSKEVKTSKQVHHHFARMTVDPEGKVLKISESR